ncbi:TPA: hypothetical protein O1V02_002840, partial [Staphylococcus aureus]|nr:hypothetical protein [Staphylococcus aureus]
AGYAHGLSGIIYTLNSIYKNFETKETSNKILNLISLEDSYFNNKIGNYLDARSNVYDHYYLCYGLPGILQVRLRLESTFKNKEFIKKSLLKLGNLILNDKIEFNSLSLCHGIGSILDLFIDAKN